MKSISLTVNGTPVSGSVEPRTHLADFIRGQVGLTGTHLGCEQGVCGACTVMIDGRPARSCIAFAAACDGAEIRTVEGFDDDAAMAQIRDAFSAHHGLQCGFCTPGMLITARDIIGRLEQADEATIRRELSGNICRCTGYQGIVSAIADVIDTHGRQPLSNEVAPIGDRTRPAPVAPPPTFKRVATEHVSTAVKNGKTAKVSAPVMEVDAEGWTVLSQTLEVSHGEQSVWDALEDVRSVARCMPGAEVASVEDDRIDGHLRIKFGPISAAFAGEATREMDPAARRATLAGKGTDSGSGTRAQGAVTYAVRAIAAGQSVVDIVVRFKLSGPLAQFSRSGLVKDFAARLTDQFAENLSRLLAGEDVDASSTANELNAISLLWSVLLRRVKAMFGSRVR